MTQCLAYTEKNVRCKKNALKGCDFCYTHYQLYGCKRTLRRLSNDEKFYSRKSLDQRKPFLYSDNTESSPKNYLEITSPRHSRKSSLMSILSPRKFSLKDFRLSSEKIFEKFPRRRSPPLHIDIPEDIVSMNLTNPIKMSDDIPINPLSKDEILKNKQTSYVQNYSKSIIKNLKQTYSNYLFVRRGVSSQNSLIDSLSFLADNQDDIKKMYLESINEQDWFDEIIGTRYESLIIDEVMRHLKIILNDKEFSILAKHFRIDRSLKKLFHKIKMNDKAKIIVIDNAVNKIFNMYKTIVADINFKFETLEMHLLQRYLTINIIEYDIYGNLKTYNVDNENRFVFLYKVKNSYEPMFLYSRDTHMGIKIFNHNDDFILSLIHDL